jgi:protoheme IX farnesyltransferase
MNSDSTSRAHILTHVRALASGARAFWSLTKGLQTALLVITGLGGYMSSFPPSLSWQGILAVAGSLFLAISGSTMLNMVYDRDIDARMQRTARRPLPAGRVSPGAAVHVGLAISGLGIGWAFSLGRLYGLIVSAGLFFDVIVYTLWLKRRTSWSILWGGISGGMPILAGRALGLGHIDSIGLFLALGVLTWIPSHIMPLTIKYLDDYRQAGVPTFPDRYGLGATRAIISFSASVTVVVMLVSARLSGVHEGCLVGLGMLGLALLLAAILNILRPTPALNFGLFKLASFYMLGAMALMIVN